MDSFHFGPRETPSKDEGSPKSTPAPNTEEVVQALSAPHANCETLGGDPEAKDTGSPKSTPAPATEEVVQASSAPHANCVTFGGDPTAKDMRSPKSTPAPATEEVVQALNAPRANCETLDGDPEANKESRTNALRPVREGLSRRHSVRLTSPILAYVDGTKVSVLDWSTTGLRLRTPAPLSLPATIAAELVSEFAGCTIRVPLTCKSVWDDALSDQSGWRFVDIDANASRVLRTLFAAALEGRIPETDELLQLPPDRASEALFPITTGGGSVSSAARRIGGYLMLSCGGLVLSVIAGLAIYDELFSISADIAAVSAPSEQVVSPTGGIPSAPLLAQGQRVQKGQVLAVLRNEQLAGAREVAAADLRREEANLAALEDRRRTREKFFTEYQRLAQSDLDRTRAELKRAQATLEITERTYERARQMQRAGHMADAAFDVHAEALVRATRDFATAKAQLGMAESNNRMAQSGHYYTGSRIEGADLADLENHIRVNAAAVEAARARFLAIDQHIAGLTLRSPCDCTVQSSLGNRTWVQQGETLYVLTENRSSDRRVQALVSQENAARIAVGSPAFIRFADHADVVVGRVAAVDRQRRDPHRLGLPAPQANDPRFATVLVDTGLANNPEIGMPAVVRFNAGPSLVQIGSDALASVYRRNIQNGLSAFAGAATAD
jgi:multidrug resistance efflux pump